MAYDRIRGRVRRNWHRVLPLLGLVLLVGFIVAIFQYPELTEELAAIGTVALTYGLVYLYYQQKSILATEHEPDIILEGVKEVEADIEERRLLALALSNVGKGQATDLEARIESELNNPGIPKEERAKRLNRYDEDLEGWFQKPGIADYLNAGERKKIFIVDFTKELIFGTDLGGLIGSTAMGKNSWDALDADRLFLKMEICYQDTMGRTHSDLAFDYVGPFEERITLSEFFTRGYQRETYEDLKQSFEDGWVDSSVSEQYDLIDIADGVAFEAITKSRKEEREWG